MGRSGCGVCFGCGCYCVLTLRIERDDVDERGEADNTDLLGELVERRTVVAVGGCDSATRLTCRTFSRGLCRRLQDSGAAHSDCFRLSRMILRWLGEPMKVPQHETSCWEPELVLEVARRGLSFLEEVLEAVALSSRLVHSYIEALGGDCKRRLEE